MKKTAILLENKQDWNDYQAIEYTCIIDNEVIYSYCISTIEKNEYFNLDNSIMLSNVYVQKKYRQCGYFNEIINQVFNTYKCNIFINCKKGYWLIDKYKSFGFVYYKEYDGETNSYIKVCCKT